MKMTPLSAAPNNNSMMMMSTNFQQEHNKTMMNDFYNPTTLWEFLTECLHWHYTGVYWPSGSQGKQYGVDFFYSIEEIVRYCHNQNFHVIYQQEYQHWMYQKNSGKHCAFGRDEIVLPSRKKARRSCGNGGMEGSQQMEFLNFALNKENAATMECS